MTFNKKIVSLAVLTLILVLTASLSLVYAHSGKFGYKWGGKFSHQKYQQMTEKTGVMNEIFENNDYGAWKALMEEKMEKMREEVSEERFSQMVKIYDLMQQGEYEQIKELKQEMGFDLWGAKKDYSRFHSFGCSKTK